MAKAKRIVARGAMFALLGVLLVASGLTVYMWQFHAIALWGIVLMNIGGASDAKRKAAD